MRSSTAGEQTVLAATYRKTYFRVDIADPVGAMQDMSNFASLGWLLGVTIDEDIDQPIASCTVRLRREARISGGYSTLAPMRTDSPANPLGSSVDVYRSIKVYMAVVTGARPAAASTDWKLKFDGVTDRVSMPDDETIVVSARDKGSYLMDQWVTGVNALPELISGAFDGVYQTLAIVVNALLAYAPIGGVAQEATVPTDPAFTVTSFPLRFEPVMIACRRAAELAVCDFRYAWTAASSSYTPTLAVPNRAATSSWTYNTNSVVGWKRFDRDRLGVRNYIVVEYPLKTSTSRTTVTSEDSTSIASFGKRVLTIQEPDDSPINTAAQAQTMADLIKNDLKDPKAEGEVEILPDWRVELNDYVTFGANKFFDIAQDLAIVGIRHELEADKQRTYLAVRGTPSAGYQRWVQRAKDLDPENLTPADNGISELEFTDNLDGSTRTWAWTRGANVAFVAFYEALVTSPVTSASWPPASTIASLAATQGSGARILGTVEDTYEATRPEYGSVRIAMLVPYYKQGGAFVQGDAVKLQLDGKLIAGAQGTVGVGENGAVTFSIDGPYGCNSIRYSTSTSAFPADATVAASGTLINARFTGEVTPGVTLSFGQTVYITAVPFSGSSGSGSQLPSIRLIGKRETFTATKSVYFGVGSMAEFTDPKVGYTLSSGALSLKGNGGADQTFGCLVVIPDGCTLTDLYAATYNANPVAEPEVQAFDFSRVDGAGAATSIGSSSGFVSSSWNTIHLTFSQLSTGFRFLFTTTLKPYANGNIKFGGFYVTYSQPNPTVSV